MRERREDQKDWAGFYWAFSQWHELSTSLILLFLLGEIRQCWRKKLFFSWGVQKKFFPFPGHRRGIIIISRTWLRRENRDFFHWNWFHVYRKSQGNISGKEDTALGLSDQRVIVENGGHFFRSIVKRENMLTRSFLELEKRKIVYVCPSLSMWKSNLSFVYIYILTTCFT